MMWIVRLPDMRLGASITLALMLTVFVLIAYYLILKGIKLIKEGIDDGREWRKRKQEKRTGGKKTFAYPLYIEQGSLEEQDQTGAEIQRRESGN